MLSLLRVYYISGQMLLHFILGSFITFRPSTGHRAGFHGTVLTSVGYLGASGYNLVPKVLSYPSLYGQEREPGNDVALVKTWSNPKQDKQSPSFFIKRRL